MHLINRARNSILHRYRYQVAKPRLLNQISSRLIPELSKIDSLPQNTQIWYFGQSECVSPLELDQPTRQILPDALLAANQQYDFPQPSVALVPDARLAELHLGTKRLRSILALTPDGYLLNETTIRQGYVQNRLATEASLEELQNLAEIRWTGPTHDTLEIDLACVVPILHPETYYHWIVEKFPRLNAVSFIEDLLGERVTLLISDESPPYIETMLTTLGFKTLRLSTADVLIHRLVVPSFQQLDRLPAPAACQWLYDRIQSTYADLPAAKNVFSPYVYISRDHAARRRVLNEDEVLEHLVPLGFEKYYLEDLSLIEQVNLFHTAKVIVGPFGSGHSNIIFSSHSALVECGGPPIDADFFKLAMAVGIPYHFFPVQQDKIDDDFDINPLKLVSLIQHLPEFSS